MRYATSASRDERQHERFGLDELGRPVRDRHLGGGIIAGRFRSLNSGSVNGTGDAFLVSVEGNTYLSVPILGVRGRE